MANANQPTMLLNNLNRFIICLLDDNYLEICSAKIAKNTRIAGLFLIVFLRIIYGVVQSATFFTSSSLFDDEVGNTDTVS